MAFRSPGDYNHFVQEEASYGVSPGALAGTDAFMSRTASMLTKIIERRDRDMDGDGLTSVVTTQLGRESGSFDTGECDVVPSGNASTPTAPDMGSFFKAHMGQQLTGVAHTTLAAGSTTTVLEFTPGGGAASGVAVGQMIAIDVSAAFGYEVREVTVVSTDTVTVDRALSAAPAAGRTVKTGVTYRVDGDTMLSLYLWEYLGQGNNFRHVGPGAHPTEMKLGCDFTQAAPVVTCQFSGPCQKVDPGATSYPTPSTAGLPLIPTETKVWVGTTKLCVTKAEVNSNNGVELRNDQSCFLYPTGLKRTGNNGRWNVTLDLSLILETGTIEGYYDGADALTAYDVLVQMGITPGSGVAFRTRKFIPDAEVGDSSGLVSLDLSGRCYANTEEDELVVFFW
jgi:hypothetical protein